MFQGHGNGPAAKRLKRNDTESIALGVMDQVDMEENVQHKATLMKFIRDEKMYNRKKIVDLLLAKTQTMKSADLTKLRRELSRYSSRARKISMVVKFPAMAKAVVDAGVVFNDADWALIGRNLQLRADNLTTESAAASGMDEINKALGVAVPQKKTKLNKLMCRAFANGVVTARNEKRPPKTLPEIRSWLTGKKADLNNCDALLGFLALLESDDCHAKCNNWAAQYPDSLVTWLMKYDDIAAALTMDRYGKLEDQCLASVAGDPAAVPQAVWKECLDTGKADFVLKVLKKVCQECDHPLDKSFRGLVSPNVTAKLNLIGHASVPITDAKWHINDVFATIAVAAPATIGYTGKYWAKKLSKALPAGKFKSGLIKLAEAAADAEYKQLEKSIERLGELHSMEEGAAHSLWRSVSLFRHEEKIEGSLGQFAHAFAEFYSDDAGSPDFENPTQQQLERLTAAHAEIHNPRGDSTESFQKKIDDMFKSIVRLEMDENFDLIYTAEDFEAASMIYESMSDHYDFLYPGLRNDMVQHIDQLPGGNANGGGGGGGEVSDDGGADEAMPNMAAFLNNAAAPLGDVEG